MHLTSLSLEQLVFCLCLPCHLSAYYGAAMFECCSCMTACMLLMACCLMACAYPSPIQHATCQTLGVEDMHTLCSSHCHLHNLVEPVCLCLSSPSQQQHWTAVAERVWDMLVLPDGRSRVSGGLYRTKQGGLDYSHDFFGKAAFLTVSGQLQAEYFATALSNVYTFAPTFRAEGETPSLLMPDSG